MNRRRILVGLKIVLSAGFLAVLFSVVEPVPIGQVLDHPRVYFWWLASIPIQIFVIVLQALCWRVLFGVDEPLDWYRSLRGTLIVSFAGTFTPGRFSGRLAAPFVFRGLDENRSLGFSTAVVYLHTAAYLTAYGFAAGLGLWILTRTAVEAPSYLLAVPVAAYLLTGLGLLVGAGWVIRSENEPLREDEADYPWPISMLVSGWRNILNNQSRHLSRFSGHFGTLCTVLLLFFISVSVLPGIRIHLLLRGVGLNYSPWALMFILPAVYSVTILPISLGGIGLAEGSAVGVLALLGLNPSQTVSVVLLDRILSVYLPAVLGWFFFMALPGSKGSLKSATSSAE